MSEHEHPSALALDSLAAGDPVPEARAHVDTCAACTEYVETLRAEAAAFANAPAPTFLANLESLAVDEIEPTATAKKTSPEAPRPEAPRAEDTSAPYSDETHAPRAKETSAPHTDETHAPRAEETSAPYSDEIRVEEIRVEPRGPANDVGADASRVSSIADARAKRARVFNFVYAVIPLALVAAAFFVLRPSGTPGPDGFPTASTEATMRLKGPPVLAVVRERQGNQERFTSAIAVAPDDRLRLELTVDREGMYEAGLLGEDGSWLMLLSPTMLTPGAHFSEKAAHMDDTPTPGWLLAGPPEDVARARATRDFSGLAVLAVKVAPSP